MHFSRRITARMVFLAGLILMTLGIAFLLKSMAGFSAPSALWPFLFVIIGLIFVILAIKLNKRSIYFFFAAFSFFAGIFLFLLALKILPVSLAQSWPLLSVFAGLALFPAGWHHFNGIRYRFLIPSLAFAGLGCILLIFSFKVVSFSFRRFMANWWPLLFLLAGLILVLLSLNPKERNRPDHPKNGSGE
jgi:hypothetical protein